MLSPDQFKTDEDYAKYLRDYFMAHAPITYADALAVYKGKADSAMMIEWLVRRHTQYADAMLEARKK